MLLLIELFFPSRVWMAILLAFASVTAIAAWWAWQMAQGVRVRRDGARLGLPPLWEAASDCVRRMSGAAGLTG